MPQATRTHASRRFSRPACLGAAGVGLLALTLAAAAGPDGRRGTLGANQPTAQTLVVTPVPYERLAAMSAPAVPPSSLYRAPEPRATEPKSAEPKSAADPIRVQDGPDTSGQPAVRVAPSTAPIEASAAGQKTDSAAKAKPVTYKSRGNPGTLRANVKAPNTRVVVHDRRVRVNAPHTRVAVDEGRVRVRAPYVDLDIRF